MPNDDKAKNDDSLVILGVVHLQQRDNDVANKLNHSLADIRCLLKVHSGILHTAWKKKHSPQYG